MGLVDLISSGWDGIQHAAAVAEGQAPVSTCHWILESQIPEAWIEDGRDSQVREEVSRRGHCD